MSPAAAPPPPPQPPPAPPTPRPAATPEQLKAAAEEARELSLERRERIATFVLGHLAGAVLQHAHALDGSMFAPLAHDAALLAESLIRELEIRAADEDFARAAESGSAKRG